MKKYIYVIAVVTLLGATAFCIHHIYNHYAQIEKQNKVFYYLAKKVNQTQKKDRNYEELASKNPDMVGWIKIAGTTINYPVMQTPSNPNFYLKHNFYKKYSDLGVPYIQENCNMDTSDNLIIYGHHIKGPKMFGALEYYNSSSFYKKHKIIQFDTLNEHSQYEIIAVFKTIAYSPKGFRYYDYVGDGDKSAFNAYVSKCKELALYNTGISADYGENLISLSTCEYSSQNGRLVVVAKKID